MSNEIAALPADYTVAEGCVNLVHEDGRVFVDIDAYRSHLAGGALAGFTSGDLEDRDLRMVLGVLENMQASAEQVRMTYALGLPDAPDPQV